jgi:thiamine phosphate synthase YjbQ (UPF0047 family)
MRLMRVTKLVGKIKKLEVIMSGLVAGLISVSVQHTHACMHTRERERERENKEAETLVWILSLVTFMIYQLALLIS